MNMYCSFNQEQKEQWQKMLRLVQSEAPGTVKWLRGGFWTESIMVTTRDWGQGPGSYSWTVTKSVLQDKVVGWTAVMATHGEYTDVTKLPAHKFLRWTFTLCILPQIEKQTKRNGLWYQRPLATYELFHHESVPHLSPDEDFTVYLTGLVEIRLVHLWHLE